MYVIIQSQLCIATLLWLTYGFSTKLADQGYNDSDKVKVIDFIKEDNKAPKIVILPIQHSKIQKKHRTICKGTQISLS